MIELTEQQAEAVARSEHLPVVVDPRTRQEFVLVPRARYEAMQKWMASLKRRWDDPADDDLIRAS
jgi:PHD/YefM family antitoxin component YafN of YafNO toxin-antitoxin module